VGEKVRWVSAGECAEQWGVSARTVRRWVGRGWIEGMKLGPRTLRVAMVEDEDVQEEGSREEVSRPCR
jgi:hypothetical protein